jgi:uncharacterized membrane protein
MAIFTVWRLDSAEGAGEASAMLRRLQKQHMLQVQDAAAISWPPNAKRPTITLLHDLVGSGALGGAFWGMLFGLLFFVPLLGVAIAAGFGALIASTSDIGIEDKVIKELRDKITSGTSAVLLLSASAVTDEVLEEMKAQPRHAEFIEAILTRDQEAKLRGIFVQQPAMVAEETPPSVDSPPPRARAAALYQTDHGRVSAEEAR